MFHMILFEMNFRSFEIKIEGSYFRLRQAWIFRVEFRVEFGSSFDWPKQCRLKKN